MARKKKELIKDPKLERTEIGTPAGESPEKGRERHGTECLTGVCEVKDEFSSRKTIEDAEDFDEMEEEIGPEGVVTGTHVKNKYPTGKIRKA